MSSKKNQSSSFAVASFVCSLCSWLVLGIILAPLSIVFGCISISRNERNKGLAISGLVIGSVALAVLLLSLAIISAATKYV